MAVGVECAGEADGNEGQGFSFSPLVFFSNVQLLPNNLPKKLLRYASVRACVKVC